MRLIRPTADQRPKNSSGDRHPFAAPRSVAIGPGCVKTSARRSRRTESFVSTSYVLNVVSERRLTTFKLTIVETRISVRLLRRADVFTQPGPIAAIRGGAAIRSLSERSGHSASRNKIANCRRMRRQDHARLQRAEFAAGDFTRDFGVRLERGRIKLRR